MTPNRWDRIQELFEGGLRLSSAERAKFLAGLRADPDLAAQLENLWRNAESPGFLDSPMLPGFEAEHEQGVAAPRDRFDAYRTVGVLGEGGMGIVYLAVQEFPIRRRVALKVVKHGLNTREVLARFESERQALALMDHPGIAKIYAAGAAEDGRPYFVMEYVQGIPITEYCDRNLLGYRERLLLFQQVCYAVHHAHQRGVLHRDIKPSNVLVSVQDGQAQVKVIDFGVAKALNQPLSAVAVFTEFGTLVGTPEYMSPEQARASEAPVDTTSDVYSLGVLGYELLVGALPFDATLLRNAGMREIQRVIREEESPRPTTRLSSMGAAAEEVAQKRRSTVRSLLRALRGDLELILMKALEKESARRYASASEFAADIGRHLAHEPVLASPPSFWRHMRKFARRHRAGAVAGLLVLLVVLGSLAATSVLYLRAERARAEAEQRYTRANLEAARSDIDQFRPAEARELLFKIQPAWRNWEWRHLYWRSDTSVATLNCGDSGFPARVAFTPDGAEVFVANRSSVHSWRLGTFQRTGDYGGFGFILGMSGDGHYVASRLAENRETAVQVLETSTGAAVATLHGHRSVAVEGAFSRDTARLATLSVTGEIRVWDVRAQKLIGTASRTVRLPRRDKGYPNERITLSPNGHRVAITEYNGIRLIDADTGRSVWRIEAHQGPVQSLQFTSDGRRLVSACESVREWDVLTGRLVHSWKSSMTKIFSIAAEHPNGSKLVAAEWLPGIHIVDVQLGETVGSFTGPGVSAPAALAWTPDGRYLVHVDILGVVRIWNGSRPDGQVLKRADDDDISDTDSESQKRHAGREFSAMAVAPDGRRLAVGVDETLEIIDSSTGKSVIAWPRAHTGALRSVAWQPGGEKIASLGQDDSIAIWNPPSRSPLVRLPGGGVPVTSIAWSPDGAKIASGAEDGTVLVREVESGAAILTKRLPGKVRAVTFSPDGRMIAAGLQQNGPETGDLVRLFASANGVDLPRLEGLENFRGAGRSLIFSHASDWIAAGDAGLDGGAIWSARSGKLLRRLEVAGKNGVSCRWMALSPDGSRLVATYGDGMMSIWDPRTGNLVLQLFRKAQLQTQFSPDGSRLYANTVEAIEVYDTRPAVPAEVEELLRTLGERFPLWCDVREYLRNSKVTRGLKEQALKLLEGRTELPERVANLVDSVLDQSARPEKEYELAWRRSEGIAKARPWDPSALVRVGAALYRTGRAHDAVFALEKAGNILGGQSARRQLFLAMSLARDGSVARAAAALASARLAVRRQEQMRSLLAEAESVVAAASSRVR